MSRASEITLFIIMVQAAIGFVDASGMFDSHYIDVPENNASYTIQDLSEYKASTDVDNSIVSDITAYAGAAWDAMFIGIKILFTVIFVFPTLVKVFGVPTILSIFIQAGVYYVYATWYSQYKSGKGWKQIE